LEAWNGYEIPVLWIWHLAVIIAEGTYDPRQGRVGSVVGRVVMVR
jgi:hypothetical protein